MPQKASKPNVKNNLKTSPAMTPVVGSKPTPAAPKAAAKKGKK